MNQLASKVASGHKAHAVALQDPAFISLGTLESQAAVSGLHPKQSSAEAQNCATDLSTAQCLGLLLALGTVAVLVMEPEACKCKQAVNPDWGQECQQGAPLHPPSSSVPGMCRTRGTAGGKLLHSKGPGLPPELTGSTCGHTAARQNLVKSHLCLTTPSLLSCC